MRSHSPDTPPVDARAVSLTDASAVVFDVSGDPRRLAALLGPVGDLLAEGEMAAMLDHQWRSSLRFYSSQLDEQLMRELLPYPAARRAEIGTFGGLLTDRHPPVALLRLVKNFAKACVQRVDAPLPHRLASALYFTTVAAAAIHGHAISSLDPRGMREGFTWALTLPWVTGDCRRILDEALAKSGAARKQPRPR